MLVTTGQGEGRVSIVSIDPGWLSETTASSDFRTGGADLALEEWSTFGCRGVELVDHPDEAGLVALRVARREAGWPAAAVWNFPLGRVGRLSAKIRINEAFGGALLLLSDHYSVPFDPEDALFAMFALQLEADETAASSLATKEGTTGARALGPRVLPAGIARCLLSCGDWHDLELTWDCDDGTAELRVDGEVAGNLGQLRQADGVCYLRLKSTAEVPDGGFDTVAVEAVVTGSQPGPS